ncbi:unnamed protein product [Rhizophagus irregularis]|nr:unnamed protein product [Rhizophagus irregularis]
MPKSKELTEFERGEIVGLSKINLSVRKIAEVLLIAKSTVQDVINKYRRCRLITAAPRSGRPPILTPRNTRTLIKMVKKDRQTSLEELTEDFNKTLQISVCSKTVKQRKVRMHNPLPKNKRELMTILEDEWHKLEPEKLTKLIDSMPRRVKAVIKSKGNPTKY